MRYDFAFYNENTTEPQNFENKLTVFSDYMKSHPNNTRMFEIYSDPPTVTM